MDVKWLPWLAIGWTVWGMAQAEDSARVTRTLSLPSFGFGTISQSADAFGELIAEADGDGKSAALYYGRVQPDPIRDMDPVSTYNLAQRRLSRK
jgi:hypothetical protein